MKLKLGDLEFNLQLNIPPGKRLSDLSAKELSNLTVTLSPPEGSGPMLDNYSRPQSLSKRDLLMAAGFSEISLVKASKATTGFKHLKTQNFTFKFDEVSAAVTKWFKRDLSKESIWALFVSRVEFNVFGKKSIALGLNNKNQFIFLGISEAPAKDLFASLKASGLKTQEVKFGLVSFSAATPKDFHASFPKAKLGRDWMEFIEMEEDDEAKEELRQAMVNPDAEEVRVVLAEHDGPKELLNYLSFNKRVWRVLRALNTLNKVVTDFDARLSKVRPHVTTDDDLEFLFRWTVIRLQGQWYKTPADSPVLDNLKYIAKAKEEEGDED